MFYVLCSLHSYCHELVVRMLLGEKLGLNPMQSKAIEILNTENTTIFLLIMKKNSDRLFNLCSVEMTPSFVSKNLPSYWL